ncbi:hypothetical protein N8I77_006653 [Diaporthe amygdali]|uniref:Uncharacterized protein n=1 Tax=Phomopsis amygdali TaxID=1214568 RepID=A0AAD9SHT5_PHOAM|nr:hypothetical protein N8I77_006653 [Diaporthe amygdali]
MWERVLEGWGRLLIALWRDEGVLGRVCGVGWLGALGGRAEGGGISRDNLGGRLLWYTCKLLGNVHGFWRLCYIFMLWLLSLSFLICDIGLFLGRIKGSRIVIDLRLRADCCPFLLRVGGGSLGNIVVKGVHGRVRVWSHGCCGRAEGVRLEGDYVWIFGLILELWENLWESVCVMKRARRDGAEVGNSLELGALVVCHQGSARRGWVRSMGRASRGLRKQFTGRRV